jgi:hypothetical protein
MLKVKNGKVLLILLMVVFILVASGCTTESQSRQLLLTREVLSTQDVGERIISLPTEKPSATKPPTEVPATPCCTLETEIPQPSSTSTAPVDPQISPTASMFTPGGKQWAAVYRGSGDATGYSVAELRDGGIIILGRYAEGAGSSKPWLLRLAPDGSIAWSQTFTDVLQSALYPTIDGGFLLIGAESLVKFDADGSFLWQNTYTRPAEQISYPSIGTLVEVVYETDGGALFLAMGGVVSRLNRGGVLDWQEILLRTWNNAAAVNWMSSDAGLAAGQEGRNGFWIERNGSTSPSWRQTISFNEKDIPTRTPLLIRGLSEGEILFVGPVYAYTRLGGSDLYIARFNASGDILWHQILQGGVETDLNAIETRDGGFLITAATTFAPTGEQGSRTYLRMIRFNQAGTLIWDRLFGDGEIEIDINHLIQSRDGGFILVGDLPQPVPGQSEGSGGVFVLKVDRQGMIPGCTWNLDSPLVEVVTPSPTVDLVGQDDFERLSGQFEVMQGGFQTFAVEGTDAQVWQICVHPSQ